MKNQELFKKTLIEYLGVVEGGYSNHKADKGGATNRGITQKTYDNYRKVRCLPLQDVRKISDQEVELIYIQYWTEANCHNMTDKFAVLCFDTAVNHGVGKVKQFLEYAEYKYVDKFLAARKKYYMNIVVNDPTQKVFLNGWLNRLKRLENFITAL